MNDQQFLALTSSSKSVPTSLLTEESRKCKKGWHNPKAAHPKATCWFLYPHLRPVDNSSEVSVSSFHSTISKFTSNFILDSGSSSHMVFDINLFITIDLKEQGVVRTSSGHDDLEIKGIGTIKLSNEFGDLILNRVLYVPNLVINLLSVRCLVLDDFDVRFLKNSFSLSRNNQIVLSGRYEGNLPCLNFCNPKEKSYLSSSELLHKSLGHVSYHRIRQKLGIPLRNIKASRPFEELHLDLIGPISPTSHNGDRYILTVVDSHTRYCSATPLNSKSDVFETLTTIIDFEAKRFGYYPSILHSDRVSTLTLNQIPSHRSSKSPYELFKGRSIPVDFFRPIGNPVSFLIQPKKPGSKIYPKGSKGQLIGYNEELLSYRILTEDGRIVDTKSLQFLDFMPERHTISDDDESFEIVNENIYEPISPMNKKESLEFTLNEDQIKIKEEDPDPNFNENHPEVIPLNFWSCSERKDLKNQAHEVQSLDWGPYILQEGCVF
ncbi:hypothetical protein VP01_752g1 [Puccinia sorghi]|uniref:Integrase catalytic domain-containing protein n=1 Tax=Puccinia sorghi TaxID=27349 RepID=A0A0L6UC68_9BASI|nr:hypothetical protein VP01_752g1 [Puccinia sorghi]